VREVGEREANEHAGIGMGLARMQRRVESTSRGAFGFRDGRSDDGYFVVYRARRPGVEIRTVAQWKSGYVIQHYGSDRVNLK